MSTSTLHTIEVCIDSLESALAAAPYLRHNDRFEVCSNLLHGGGLTPSLGLVRALRYRLPNVGLMVMVRPRTGSFVYSESELETMELDIAAFKDEGVMGVVFGCLTDDGQVDRVATAGLAAAARPLHVTFHRAFDVTPSWRQAHDDVLAASGITRILTSGHAKTALDGADELDALTRHVSSTASALIIVAASGVGPGTLPGILSQAPALQEIHLSASGPCEAPPSETLVRGSVLGFGSGDQWRLDASRLADVRALVDSRSHAL